MVVKEVMMELMTLEETRQYLKLKSKQTIYNWVCNGLIPYHKIGGCLRFIKEEIDNWVKNPLDK